MGLATFRAAVLADNPKAYWPCQDLSGLPQDVSGNALHFTSSTGTADYGQTGFCGNDVAIRIDDAERFSRAVVSTATNNLTFMLFYRHVSSANADSILFENGSSAGNGYSLLFGVGAEGKFRVLLGGVAFLATSTAVISTGGNFLIHIVRRSGTWEYWVNGVIDTANAGTNAPATPSTATVLGSPAAPQTLKRVNAHVALFETALSSGRIAAHHAAASASDFSPKVIIL